MAKKKAKKKVARKKTSYLVLLTDNGNGTYSVGNALRWRQTQDHRNRGVPGEFIEKPINVRRVRQLFTVATVT